MENDNREVLAKLMLMKKMSEGSKDLEECPDDEECRKKALERMTARVEAVKNRQQEIMNFRDSIFSKEGEL